jgi:diguanylate cyclase (GGDEF)-like protein
MDAREGAQTIADPPVADPPGVLLVEDSPGDAELVAELLAELGQPAPYVAVRLAHALDRISRTPIGCVLLDLGLPDVDDLEGLLQLQRADPSVPVVVLTGRNDRELGEEAVRLGAQDYLVKGQLTAPLLDRALRYAAMRQRQHVTLAHQALHDPLTGLPNRALFGDRLQMALARLERDEGSVGLLFLDLDGLKAVNDSLGHGAGDQLIVEVGRRVQSALRSADTLARIGGDEFAVICPGVGGPQEVAMIAERVREAVSAPYRLGAPVMFPSVSIGISLTGDPKRRPDDLLAQADGAMYEAKRNRREQVDAWNRNMDQPTVVTGA